MADLTLLVMARTKTHTLDAEHEAGRWREGEIVYAMPHNGRPSLNPTFVHVHVLGCPISVNRANEILGEMPVDQKTGLPTARRRFALNPSRVSDAGKTAGRRDGQLTIEWSALIGALGKRTDPDDPLAFAVVSEAELRG